MCIIAHIYHKAQRATCSAAGAALGLCSGLPAWATQAQQRGNPGQNANSRRMCVRSVRKKETLHSSCHNDASGQYFLLSVYLIHKIVLRCHNPAKLRFFY